MAIEVKVNRLYRFQDEEKNLKAMVDIEINDSFLIKGVSVLKGKNGLFVSMPRKKGKDNKWYETVRPMTPEIKSQVASIVLSAYGDGESV